MIVKEREIPIELFKLEALHGRLNNQHDIKDTVLMDYKKMRRQVSGEKQVDFPLSFLSKKDYLILNNLRLKDDVGPFQIDTLLLERKLGIILEVKNWYGTILFGQNGQVTRIGDDGIEEGFSNPVPQAMLQKHRLQKWLQINCNVNLPLYYIVVISFPSTIIKAIPPYTIPEGVIHNNQLLFTVLEMEKLHSNSMVEMPTLMNIAKTLANSHVEKKEDLFKKYNLSLDGINKGVICPNCHYTPMIRKSQKWKCKKCHYTDSHAHLNALRDYRLLIDKYISNREAREFLLVNSPYIVKYLLQKGNFKSVGNTSDRRYELEFDFSEAPKSGLLVPN